MRSHISEGLVRFWEVYELFYIIHGGGGGGWCSATHYFLDDGGANLCVERIKRDKIVSLYYY